MRLAAAFCAQIDGLVFLLLRSPSDGPPCVARSEVIWSSPQTDPPCPRSVAICLNFGPRVAICQISISLWKIIARYELYGYNCGSCDLSGNRNFSSHCHKSRVLSRHKVLVDVSCGGSGVRRSVGRGRQPHLLHNPRRYGLLVVLEHLGGYTPKKARRQRVVSRRPGPQQVIRQRVSDNSAHPKTDRQNLLQHKRIRL